MYILSRSLLVVSLVVGLVCFARADQREPIRNAGCVVLDTSPTLIGTGKDRTDLIIHNDVDSLDPCFCGYDPNSLSSTPGENSGDKLSPGIGKGICVYPNELVYCLTAGVATVCYDEARVVALTPTITKTPTVTATSVNTQTPKPDRTKTFTHTSTPTKTSTPTVTNTSTATATVTNTPTVSATVTNTSTITKTPTPTETPTATPTETASVTPSPT